MNAVYVIIYHTQEEYAQYQIPVTVLPAEIREKLYRCNGTVVNCSDDEVETDEAVEVIDYLELPETKQYKVSEEMVLGTDCAIAAVFNIGFFL